MIFIKYANFIRRVPLDFIKPADEYSDDINEEVDKEDIDHAVRLDDDKFENVEIIVKKDREIEQLKKSMAEQGNVIKEMETNIAADNKNNKQTQITKLPNIYQTIVFKESKTGNILRGKVVNKQKKASINKNILGIKLEDDILKDFDFMTDIDEWMYAKDSCENTVEPCCLYSIASEEIITHDCFATVLTKNQIKNRPGAENAMKDEIRKFENFGAFKTVDDNGQYAIRTRWVITENDDESKGYKLKNLTWCLLTLSQPSSRGNHWKEKCLLSHHRRLNRMENFGCLKKQHMDSLMDHDYSTWNLKTSWNRLE